MGTKRAIRETLLEEVALELESEEDLAQIPGKRTFWDEETGKNL